MGCARLGLGALGGAAGFKVGPEVVEGGRDLLLAEDEVLIKGFAGGGEALVEVHVLDLLGDAAVDVVEGEAACGRVPGIDNVEEVRVSEVGPDVEVVGRFPGVEPGFAEVEGRITLDVDEG